MAITFSSPNICTVGAAFDDLDPEEIETGEMRLGPVGRALLMGANRGIIRLYAQKSSGVLLGATVIAERGEHLAHLLAWCIGEQMTVPQLLRKPFYHPTMEEAIQGALKDLLQKLDLPTSPPDVPPDLEVLN